MTDTTARLVDSYYETLKDGAASFDADRLREILAAPPFNGP